MLPTRTDRPPQRPEKLAPALEAALGLASNLPPGESAGLSEFEGAALEARAQWLERALAPCPESRIVQLLASFQSMPTRRDLNPREAEFAAAQTVGDLAGLPDWALDEAARAIRCGEAGLGHQYRPTAAEFRAATRRRAEPYAAELAKIRRALERPAAGKARETAAAARKATADLVRAACGIAPKADAAGAPPRRAADERPAPPGTATLGELAERFRATPPLSTPEMAQDYGAAWKP
jgi:hypothetical protein